MAQATNYVRTSLEGILKAGNSKPLSIKRNQSGLQVFEFEGDVKVVCTSTLPVSSSFEQRFRVEGPVQSVNPFIKLAKAFA